MLYFSDSTVIRNHHYKHDRQLAGDHPPDYTPPPPPKLNYNNASQAIVETIDSASQHRTRLEQPESIVLVTAPPLNSLPEHMPEIQQVTTTAHYENVASPEEGCELLTEEQFSQAVEDLFIEQVQSDTRTETFEFVENYKHPGDKVSRDEHEYEGFEFQGRESSGVSDVTKVKHSVNRDSQDYLSEDDGDKGKLADQIHRESLDSGSEASPATKRKKGVVAATKKAEKDLQKERHRLEKERKEQEKKERKEREREEKERKQREGKERKEKERRDKKDKKVKDKKQNRQDGDGALTTVVVTQTKKESQSGDVHLMEETLVTSTERNEIVDHEQHQMVHPKVVAHR